jgi:hypothetical protein
VRRKLVLEGFTMRHASSLLFVLAASCGAATSPSTPDRPPASSSPRCTFRPDDDATRVVMTYQDRLDTVVVNANGSTRTLYTNEPPAGAGPFFSAGSGARGRFVIASASWGPNAGSLVHRDVLLDETGRVYWQRLSSTTTTPSLFLGASGVVVLQTSAWDHAPMYSGVVVSTDGSSHAYDGLRVLAAPGVDGRSPVVRVDEWNAPVRSIAWLDAATGETTPISVPLVGDQTESAQWLGDRFVFVGSTSDGPAIVVAHGASTNVIRIPGVTAGAGIQVAGAAGSRWLRVVTGTETSPAQWRVDVEHGDVSPFVALEPEALRRFTYSGASLDDSGGAMMAMRDVDVGALYVSSTGRGPWTRVGGTVSGILALEFEDHGGTYVIRGTNDRYVGETWPTMPTEIADVAGVATQLVRPSDGVSYRLDMLDPSGFDPISPTLTRDGTCAAWSTTVGSQTVITTLDVPTGHRTTFMPRSVGAYFGGFSWAESE